MTRSRVLRWRYIHLMAAVFLVVGGVSAVPAIAHAAAPLTVVTIQFDDGNADVFQWLGPLNNHGFPATFFVNSGTIGTAGHLTWAQLTSLVQAGNEVGSHTIDHVDLKKLKLADARFQVCQDRVNLFNHGIMAESFAYPFGSFDSTVETQVVQYCGDNSGRGVAGVNDRTTFAETIPPLDPYATRTPAEDRKSTRLNSSHLGISYAV